MDAHNRYRGMYDDGPYELRKRRLAKLVELGIISADVVPHEIVAPEVSEWDEFDEYEKKCSIRAMEAYAGMVEQMDASIGRVIQRLKETGEYDNTMIIFMSDNGAEGAALEAIRKFAQPHGALETQAQLSWETASKKQSTPITTTRWTTLAPGTRTPGEWLCITRDFCKLTTRLGPLWAQASTAPSRLYKCFPSEGGIRVPCVVKLPNGTYNPQWQKGGFNRSFSTCMDIAPTFLDLVGVSMKQDGNKMLHRGKLVHGHKGQSWKKYLQSTEASKDSGENQEFAFWPEDKAIGWELHAMAALKKGHYKIVFIREKHGGKATRDDDPNGWEMFNVTEDPGETVDISAKEPEKFKELMADWEVYVKETGLVWGDGAMVPGLSKEEAPHLHDVDMELQKTWLQTPSGVKVAC